MAGQSLAGLSVEDRIAIDDLYNEYLWALDTGDTQGWIDKFAPDAEVWEDQKDGSTWKGRGHDELLALITKYHADPHFPGHQHREGSRVFAPDPDGRPDHWAAKSYAFATTFDADGTYRADAYWAGYYRDIVGKIDGEWKFVHRWIAPWKGSVLERFEAKR
jgi:hypothetical protein